MFSSTLGISGRRIPTWLVGSALVVAAAGAAVGTVLVGDVQGELPTTVSQALIAGEPVAGGDSDGSFVSVTDDGTGFIAANEMNTGDMWTVTLPLANESDNDMDVLVTVDVPHGLTIDVNDADAGDTDVENVIRTGLNTWLFDLHDDADGSSTDTIEIEIAHTDDAPPGFYQVHTRLQQIDSQ